MYSEHLTLCSFHFSHMLTSNNKISLHFVAFHLLYTHSTHLTLLPSLPCYVAFPDQWMYHTLSSLWCTYSQLSFSYGRSDLHNCSLFQIYWVSHKFYPLSFSALQLGFYYIQLPRMLSKLYHHHFCLLFLISWDSKKPSTSFKVRLRVICIQSVKNVSILSKRFSCYLICVWWLPHLIF